MAGFSDYVENKVLEHIVGKTSFTMPTAYIALYTAAPTDAGGGTEVSGGSYVRKTTAGSDWATASGGSISNATILTFATPSGAWGTVTHFALMDASTSGNQLGWGALTTPQVISSGNTVSFAISALTVTLD